MNRLFDYDNPIWGFFGKVGDIFILNILFLITSLPVVTIGASLGALHYASMKNVREDGIFILSNYFHGFKDNFKKGTLVWICNLLLLGINLSSLYASTFMPGEIRLLFLFALLFILLLVLLVFTYAYPLLARFEVKWQHILVNSFFLALKHLPSTVLIMAINFAPLILLFFGTINIALFVVYYTFLGFGLSAFLSGYIYNKVFDRYIELERGSKEEEKEETDDAMLLSREESARGDKND